MVRVVWWGLSWFTKKERKKGEFEAIKVKGGQRRSKEVKGDQRRSEEVP